jgi:catechol 2,3-dioxygenase-like lactoylglutathione lyase family enzyme
VITGVHHVQITVPTGAEARARAFYVELLGLSEIPKPSSLAGRGGFWVRAGANEVHVGTEAGVDHARTKAHVAYAVQDLDTWREKLVAAGFDVRDQVPIPGFRRIDLRDPFGNRLELIEPTT